MLGQSMGSLDQLKLALTSQVKLVSKYILKFIAVSYSSVGAFDTC